MEPVKGNFFGYETYIIVEDSLRNVMQDGAYKGFRIDLRLANYRGYILSQIEDVRVSVDGMDVPRDAITFGVNGANYSLDQMQTTIDQRWGILDVATLTCQLSGGLSPGKHTLIIEEHVRPSYTPMTAVAMVARTMTVLP